MRARPLAFALLVAFAFALASPLVGAAPRTETRAYYGALVLDVNGDCGGGDSVQAVVACFDVRPGETSVAVSTTDLASARVPLTVTLGNYIGIAIRVHQFCGAKTIALPGGAVFVRVEHRLIGGSQGCGAPTQGKIVATFS